MQRASIASLVWSACCLIFNDPAKAADAANPVRQLWLWARASGSLGDLHWTRSLRGHGPDWRVSSLRSHWGGLTSRFRPTQREGRFV
jgi:hypothetical protein